MKDTHATRTGRPIGGRIHEICALAEKLGLAVTSRQIIEAAPHLSSNSVRNYCSRAASYGLMTFHAGKYSVTPEWREIKSAAESAAHLALQALDEDGPLHTTADIYPLAPMPIASVWQLGSRA